MIIVIFLLFLHFRCVYWIFAEKKLNIIKIVYFNYFDNGSSLTLIKSVIIL